VAEVLAQRERQREQLLGLARAYVQQLAVRVPVVAAAVVGSVARGDFNVWSDVDVVVVAEGLPARAPDRAAVLAADALPGVQPVGFTPEEFRRAWERTRAVAARRLSTTGNVRLALMRPHSWAISAVTGRTRSEKSRHTRSNHRS